VVALAEQEQVRPLLVKYLNRVSDLLFVMARHENYACETPEKLWLPAGQKEE
jgi:cob(I)alamin adenosyltransferase